MLTIKYFRTAEHHLKKYWIESNQANQFDEHWLSTFRMITVDVTHKERQQQLSRNTTVPVIYISPSILIFSRMPRRFRRQEPESPCFFLLLFPRIESLSGASDVSIIHGNCYLHEHHSYLIPVLTIVTFPVRGTKRAEESSEFYFYTQFDSLSIVLCCYGRPLPLCSLVWFIVIVYSGALG